MPAYAGTATAELTPGTTSNGIRARASAVGLFAAATEDERIAALQPHDPPSAPRVQDQERVDLLLRQRVVARGLPGEDAPGARRLVEETRVHEPVVDDDLRARAAARGRARS